MTTLSPYITEIALDIAQTTDSVEVLTVLSGHGWVSTHAAVDSNSHTPNRVLRKLLGDDKETVGSAISRNKSANIFLRVAAAFRANEIKYFVAG